MRQIYSKQQNFPNILQKNYHKIEEPDEFTKNATKHKILEFKLQ